MTVDIPLLHDNHNHVALYAGFKGCIDISGKAAGEVHELLRGLPRDRLSVVRGWKTNEVMLDTADLAALPPVLLVNFSLHGFAVSDAAIPFVKRSVPDIAAHRDDQSWCEANVPAIFAAYCDLTGLDEARLTAYIDGLVPLGIGSSDEMTVPNLQSLDACINSRYSGRLKLWVSPKLYGLLDKPRRDRVSGIKLYLDGAIGARSAAIRGPWIGTGKAMLTYSDAELRAIVAEVGAAGTGISMHAIGELAIAQALSAMEAAVSGGASFGTARLEHVQFIDAVQAARAKALGIVLSMQPNFSSDSRDFADRLPASYLRRNNPFRMLVDEFGFVPGRDLIFGSDGMPDGIAYAATESLFPECQSSRLSLDELVAGYGLSTSVSGTVTLDVDEKARRVSVASVSLRPHRTP